MTQQIVNIGSSENKGDGDPLRTAFQKINENFTELYTPGPTTSTITDIKGSVFADDSTLMIDAINQTMFAETLTTLAVFGNPTLALNADSITVDAQNGNLTLQTTDTITNNFVNAWEVQGTNGASIVLNDDGIVSSELSVNVAVVDFGTGNTIDMQNNTVNFTGATVTGLDAPYTPSNPAHWLVPNPTTVGEAIDRLASAISASTGSGS